MDPLTIGGAVAVLAGKAALSKLGDEAGEAGWGLAGRIVRRVKSWFAQTDPEAERALDELVAAPDPTDESVRAMAELIDTRLPAAPGVERDLSPLVEAASGDPTLAPILGQGAAAIQAGRNLTIQTAGDNAQQAGRDINITHERREQ